MVIIGLGSNIGDRLSHLRKAFNEISRMPSVRIQQASPVYYSEAMLPENAPADWNMPYLNLALRCDTSLDPTVLLKKFKQIESQIGQKPKDRHWGPRIIDIDLLAYDDRVLQSELITLPHPGLLDRPFSFWPLADVAPLWLFPLPGDHYQKSAEEIVEKWGSRFTGNAPFQTRQIQQRVDAPQLVGIVNVTPDSFSDGSEYLTPHLALHHVLHLTQSGADVIDIGAESTSPHSVHQPANPQIEWERLQPVLTEIQHFRKKFLVTPKISIDTRHVFVAEKALMTTEIDWINDVTGLTDPAMRDLVKQSGKNCIVMHSLGVPADKKTVLPRHQDNVNFVYAWAKQHLQSLEKAGIDPDKIIFDPGICFGKTAAHSLMLIQRITLFKSLGVKILVGHSRKSFFSLFTNAPFAERDVDTIAMTLYLTKQPVDYLRVHNVAMCAQAIKVMKALV